MGFLDLMLAMLLVALAVAYLLLRLFRFRTRRQTAVCSHCAKEGLH
ncbi:MAG: hypothetical protein K1X75_10075 [Leptospirales bacterium]|nr:hypothetical protein [Leptospirales bacterium]